MIQVQVCRFCIFSTTHITATVLVFFTLSYGSSYGDGELVGHFTPRKMHMHIIFYHVVEAAIFFPFREDVLEFCELPLALTMPPSKVRPQCKAIVPIR